MKFWTAHLRQGAPPVLVREGFSWGALLFGPLWLAAHRAWIPAVLTVVASLLIVLLATEGISVVLMSGVTVLLGLSGQDLRRWSLDHRGYFLAQVIAAHNELGALERLLTRRPDVAGSFLPPETAR
ncbi:MAG TPA: DUF2628 domain-containing protein [Acetobacteraceae bacterium]|nr:DUF2628 domain-containing protein [Acetobacteraceae bacterium]